MSDDFANDIDDFQELLDNLPGLAPIIPGKRGGGRTVTNNVGADTLSITILQDLRDNHHVDVTKSENLQPWTLWGVIDQKSFSRASDENDGIDAPDGYSQSGVLAVSLAQSSDKKAVLQWWKGVIVNGVLTFKKVSRKGAKYQLMQNKQGGWGFYKIDPNTGRPAIRNKRGDYFCFPYNELVVFEDYLNAIVMETEVPVSFPNETNLRGLSEILANVNVNSIPVDNSTLTSDEFEDEDEFEEVE